MRVYQLAREMRESAKFFHGWMVRLTLHQMGFGVMCDLSMVERRALPGFPKEWRKIVQSGDAGKAAVTFLRQETAATSLPIDNFNIADDHYSNGRWTEASVSYRHAMEDVLHGLARWACAFDSAKRPPSQASARSSVATSPASDLPVSQLIRDYLEPWGVFQQHEIRVVRSTYGFLSVAAHRRIDVGHARLAYETTAAVCCLLAEKVAIWHLQQRQQASNQTSKL